MNTELWMKIGRIALGVLIGAALGYGYGRLVKCVGGTCPLAGRPIVSTIWGGALGALIAWR
jgi:hypothetical protein